MVYAKKSLGQNFLKSEAALREIIEAGQITAGETVLEIGPGRGALTEYLLKAGAHVIAVEKDRELITVLNETFKEAVASGALRIIEADILEWNRMELPAQYKVIANIPYYITGAIIRMFFEATAQPQKMVLLVQKEVADRIVARDNKESILSISVKAYCTPRLVKVVKAGSFVPAPAVDSAIVEFSDISKRFFIEHGVDEAAFFMVVKEGFAHKRKVLRSNLADLATRFDKKLPEILLKTDIAGNARAEDLTVHDWLLLAKYLG